MKFGKYTKAKWIYNTEELGSCHSCDSMVVGFITTYEDIYRPGRSQDSQVT